MLHSLKKTASSRQFPLFLCLLFLSVCTGYPLALLFLQSIFPDILGGKFDNFLDAYMRIAETADILQLLINSLAWAGATTVLSWIMGIPCGYFLARTKMPGKLLARLSLLVPIMTPPYIAALSYILIMQPGGFSDSFVGQMPDALREWFFSFWGVTLVMALSSFGYVALAVEAALRSIPSRLEDAAALLGASWKQIGWRILLPLLLPAVLNSGLLVFLEALSNFGVPAVLGTRANLPLLPAEIFFLVTSWPVDLALATSLSSILCLIALLSLYGSRALSAWFGSGSYRPSDSQIRSIGTIGCLLAWTLFGGLFILSAVMPYFAMILTSFAGEWRDGIPSLTLAHYLQVFSPDSAAFGALRTSLMLSIGAASICVVAGGYIAYVNVRSDGVLQKFLDGLALLPRVIPKIVMAVALILAWNAPWIPVNIYNTVWMLLLAYIIIYITDALNYANTNLRSMSVNLENAGAVLGASRFAIFFRIVLPQLKPGLLAAWLTTFIVCMRELVASILLLPPGVDTTATYIFNQFEQGDISMAMAMASVTILLSTLVLILFQLRGRGKTES